MVHAQTPLLQQYFQFKSAHPGVIIAMRVGDFYEFYGADAETAASVLQITLTGREDGSNGRIPMAGVPFHSVEKYLAKLVGSGYKVGICDQIEDPKQARGLVKRKITRILTPGTVLEDSMLNAGANNFLAAICVVGGKAGLASLDPSTGEFWVTEIQDERWQDRFIHELARIKPAELLLPPMDNGFQDFAQGTLGIPITEHQANTPEYAAKNLQEQLGVSQLDGFGCGDKPTAVVAASMVLAYVRKNGLPLDHISTLSTYSIDAFMSIDLPTRRSLELTQNLADGSRHYTLLEVLDQCVTTMGSRQLRRWIEQPLLNRSVIESRQDTVEQCIQKTFARGSLRNALKKLNDIERLVSRTATGLATPRDLGALRNSLIALPEIFKSIEEIKSDRICELREQICDHKELTELLEKALVVDPPHTLREGGVICEGYDPELDKLRLMSRDGKQYIATLEQKARTETGISTLKVGYNSIFGYYLEVGKAHISKIPSHYIRKQTTANTERYITADLKEQESTVLGAEQKALVLENELFLRIRKRVAEHASSLLQTARALAELDTLSNLAEVALERGYIKPQLLEKDVLHIKGGRHPVVESHTSTFVPNNLLLGDSNHESSAERFIVLTGPNMSGKSTYLRQTALIVLMAQIGSYVPATSCELGLCDRIFARIGAKDELALGQSTFMVEMIESANILNNATQQSLVILDEVGRGTSTYDGLAIAWAMIEYLATIGSKTMFATHYHQLNTLADRLPTVANYRVNVEEYGDQVVWTHKVLEGGTDRSYGIHVARMAGIPQSVLKRSTEILNELEQSKSPIKVDLTPTTKTQSLQLTLFEHEEHEIIKMLRTLDVSNMTPVAALGILDKWKTCYADNTTNS